MEQDVKTFENEGYSAEATEVAGCRLSVKVVVKPKTAQKAYQKAVKKVNKQISIPGFRKGRAPDRTVISRYSSYVEQEWKEEIVGDAYRAALDLTQIYPMNRESIQKPKIEKCSQEEGAVVHISYEHYPHVPAVDFSQIKLSPLAKEPVADEKIDEVLEEVRRSHADWENVEGRAVEEGDFVDITIDSLQDDPPKPIVTDRRFEVTDKRLTPWLKNLLVGLGLGENIEGMSEVDEKAEPHIKKNFKPTPVRITLHAIKKIILPVMDDALAQKAGTPSVEELKVRIRHNLEQEADAEHQKKRMEALENALLEKYLFDLPASLVEFERKERIAKKIQALKNENMSEEEIQLRERDIESEVTSELDRDIRLYFLNKQIAKQGQISLTNQELNDEVVRYMSQNPYLYKQQNDDAATRELVSRMASALMQRKTKEYALSQVEAV